MELIVISPSSSEKEVKNFKTEDEDGTPLRPIVCLKKNADMKYFEEIEDCFILDFDPFESIDITKLSVSQDHPDNDDANHLSIIAEKGQVACRDYPHPRHLCLKFPFEATPHESHCELCYCYVCDSVAPCVHWTEPESAHCEATEHTEDWKVLRKMRKRQPDAHK